MNQEAHIRNFIRKILEEKFGSNLQEELDDDFDLSSFDKTIETLKQRKKTQEDRLNSMKKQFSIPSHPNSNINGMMKRTEKAKMDDIQDDIQTSKNQEDELKKAKEDMEKIKQQAKKFGDDMEQVQSQTTSSSEITNI